MEDSTEPSLDSNFGQSEGVKDESTINESESNQKSSDIPDHKVTNQTCHDELAVSESQSPADQTNLFLGAETVGAKSESEEEASLKFELGGEPGLDEPSPKTPEFSEIIEN